MAEILKGVRILDLSQYIAGPYGTLLLGDLGAEIIKIENPEGGDLSRNIRQYIHKGESAYYLSLNRNKKSVTINLRVKVGPGARIGNGATVKEDVPQNGIVRAGSTWP